MAFESLTDRLAGVFKKLRGHGKLSEADIMKYVPTSGIFIPVLRVSMSE